jgi:hypothetical protein
MFTANIPPLAVSDVERLLRDWRALNTELPCLPLDAVGYLLGEAMHRKTRWQVARRIYGRMNRLRMLQELKDLRKQCP